nr:hypothetical protein [uncultured Pseudomonas sp.]
MLGVPAPCRFDEGQGTPDFIIGTILFDDEVQVMAVAILVEPGNLLPFPGLASAAFLVEVIPSAIAELLKLRSDDFLQQVANDLAKTMRR